MAFVPGFNTVVLAHDADVSSYFKDVSTPASADELDTTTFGSTGHRRIGGLKDGSVSGSGLFDPGTAGVGGSDDPLSAMLAASKPWTVGYNGLAIGAVAKLVEALETAYELSESNDGLVEFSVDAMNDGAYGVETGVSLHALGAETATGNNAGVDKGALSSNGGVAHLHVTAATGSATIKIQHSTDDVTYADLVTFTATAAKTSERIEVAAATTVNRWLRVNRFAVGTSVTFQASFARR